MPGSSECMPVGLGEYGDQGRSLPKALAPSAKRLAVEMMVQEHRLSKAKACRIAGLSRAALYREPTDVIGRDAPVVTALNDTVERHGRWGFWKYFQRLRDQGHAWNHKRVHRVYCSMKLNLPRRTKKRFITRERQPLVAPDAVNQMWALDFMHAPPV
jgi:putative transposase